MKHFAASLACIFALQREVFAQKTPTQADLEAIADNNVREANAYL